MRKSAIGLCAFLLGGCAVQAEQAATPVSSNEAPALPASEGQLPITPPAGQQWLYGSAESAAASRQAYKAMTDFVVSRTKMRPEFSVVADENTVVTDGGKPAFLPCGDKPLAAIFDADETLIWNVGAMRYMAEKGKDFDPDIWDKWEKTGAGKALAMPGTIEALSAMRAAGVTIIANTNRAAINAAGTEATLEAAGLGKFTHGSTLFLMGDTQGGSSKDARREIIAAKYCVIAMAGDQLGDFRNAFNSKTLSALARKQMVQTAPFDQLWGNGWFMLPNPVYGPSIRGSFDEIFSADTKWAPPSESNE